MRPCVPITLLERLPPLHSFRDAGKLHRTLKLLPIKKLVSLLTKKDRADRVALYVFGIMITILLGRPPGVRLNLAQQHGEVATRRSSLKPSNRLL